MASIEGVKQLEDVEQTADQQKYANNVYGEKAAQPAQQGYCGADTVSGAYHERKAARPILDRLQKDIDGLSEQLDRSVKARNILHRHPEFAEFMELCSLIRVPMRIAPLQSARALVIE